MDKHQSENGTLKWSHGFLAVVLLLLLFSLQLLSLVTSQYIVLYLQKDMFPNSTLSSSNVSACNFNTSTEEYRERTAVQKAASKFNIYKTLAENLPALIISGITGGLSDKYGRRRILVLSISLTMLLGCLNSIIIYLQINIYYFLISFFIYSLGGGFYGTLSICFAYMSDVTDPGKQRTLMITLLEASLGIGSAASGFFSGFIIDSVGFFYASICVCAAAFCSMLVVVLFLPNSRPPNMLLSGTSTIENASASFVFYFRASPKRHKYILAIIIFMSSTLSLLGKSNIEILYQLNAPFCWTSVKVGYYSAISNSARMILGVACVKILQKFFMEESVAILSGVSGMAASIVEAFAINDVMLFLVPVIGFLGTLVIPMTRSILSKLTPADRQGALFAGVAVVEITSNLGSNIGASSVYIATVGAMRGFVFLVFAGLSFLTTCLLLIYRIINRGSKTGTLPDVTKDITSTQILTDHEGE
ncbi:solute carrier family 46 member 3-like [Pecten maximus]|uniref:solute carrier family 46 member 3-like n=1 Tax=Pecten maximus TaxID=6579 RepID=UPI0014589357|nr:solute carrier family 46 member 3-like [Pecten maximus]